MNQVVSISRGSRNIQGKRQKTVGREIVIGPNAIKFIAVAICAILAMVYLTQSTAGATRGVKIGNLESEKAELLRRKEQLEVEQSRLKALKEIEKGIDPNVLQAPSPVISRPNQSVAN